MKRIFDKYVTSKMARSSAILFLAIMVFASGGSALQSIKASHETSLWDEIATQVELNRIQLNCLQGELVQLEQQESFVSNCLGVYCEHFDVCDTIQHSQHAAASLTPLL
jgi:hypothetical protein